ncbi:PBP1A family penicillin-binding protein [Salibacterium salarium]|uniref:PBP1A family penicillin-binding protein n=1 Tax=Salibacterium salarium TaxID=284579 RepID=A0A3R9PLG1_9BACI|nr:PBP1A family penicillin-binding protein [Salibacterium salarium]RSL33425.1 PBP1A family penicillin-binding protein [Salibacterium salarium]
MSDKYRSRQEKRKAQESSNSKNNAKTSDKTKKSKRSKFKSILLIGFITGMLLIIGGGITAAVMISNAPALDPDELVFSQAAEIYDQNGEQVTQLQSGENRDLIDINDLSEDAKSAFIAVEDVRFYDHFGIDIQRVFGALFANFTEGFGAEGASTITQQVVKNAFLSSDKTITRKVQEQYLAIRLEQQYSKDQILEMYLNLIYFSQGAYGIGEASSVYFNHDDISELTIQDAALLAAIPRRPAHYDPIKNPEAAKDRRNTIISLMEDHDFISSENAQQAKNVNINEQIDHNPTEEGLVYDSFMSHVQNELEDVDGISSSDLYSAGLKINTTLDTEVQEYAEQVILTDEYINNYPNNEEFQVGFSLIDTETGAIKAMVGNRQSQDIAQGFNYATNQEAQPGSTIKPILDYGPAIENNQWSTYHQIVDEPHRYREGGQQIENYSGTFRGPVSMREALVDSINVPAVKALQETGYEQAGEFARGLGLPMETVNPGAALGGISPGFSSLEMAGAYAAFGNNGTYSEPYAVRSVEFQDGREINLEHESNQAMNDYTAYMITDMLKDVVDEGTGEAANIPNLPLAGKTGTTNFTEEEHQDYGIPDGGDPDVWFSGYTPQYTAAVWTGFSGDRGDNYLSGSESNIAKEIFRLIMSNASEGENTPDFTKPDSVEEIDIERSTGQRASTFTPSSEIITELFVEGTGPEDVSDEFATPSQINGLNAAYDEEADEIQLNWNYDEDELEGRTFDIEHRVEGDEYQSLTSQNDTEYRFSEPEKGTTHGFRITVVNQEGPDQSSDSAEVEINVPENDDQDQDEDEDEDESENEEDEENEPDNQNPGDGFLDGDNNNEDNEEENTDENNESTGNDDDENNGSQNNNGNNDNNDTNENDDDNDDVEANANDQTNDSTEDDD